MQRKETNFLKSILTSGLAFGIGGVLGILGLYLVIRSEILSKSLSLIPENQSFVLLLSAIVSLILVIGISSGIGGAIGGFVISRIDPIYERRKYIWRTALSFGITEALLILPFFLLTVIIALYNNGIDRDPTGQVIVFGIYGLIFGIVLGLLLGLLTVGWRQTWRVLLASSVGFGLGGAAVGYGLRIAYYPATFGAELPELVIVLPILALVFFGVGGLFLGWVFEWVTHWRVENVPHEPAKWVKTLGVIALILIGFFLISNYRQMVKFLTIRPGSVSSSLEMKTFGTQWQGQKVLSRQLSEESSAAFSMSANKIGDSSAVWVETLDGFDEVFLSSREFEADNKSAWTEPLMVSSSLESDSVHPAIFTDDEGVNHIVWTEKTGERVDIYYSRCEADLCSEPVLLSELQGVVCEGFENRSLSPINDWPDITMSSNNTLMVMWSNASGTLLYATWGADQNPPAGSTGCVVGPTTTSDGIEQYQPRISGNQSGSIFAVFADFIPGSETVYSIDYTESGWSSPQSLANGTMPDIFTDTSGVVFYSWCDAGGQVQIKNADTNSIETIPFPPCLSRPIMAEDERGRLHLVWYSDQIRNNMNIVLPSNVVYESIHTDNGWSEPAIVTLTVDKSHPEVAGKGFGELTLLWNDEANSQLHVIEQPNYSCSPDTLGRIGKVILDVAQSGSFRPQGDEIPYCNNEYIGMIYMPNPDPAFSANQPTINGGFDEMADLASLVKYEVMLSVMEWASEEEAANLNPGMVYTREIAKLYEKIKTDPSQYPRGLTVRILLGNYPELSNLEWGEQIWNVIHNLRVAGVDKMVDPQIGWKVEVANYEGVYPHSHTKFLIIDGKIAVGAGFNYGYLHFPFEHPSHKGGDLFDLGLIVSGPIAQQVLVAFDDYWQGAEQLTCPELPENPGFLWTRECTRSEAQATHVPEVMKYSIPNTPREQSNAFSLNRNINYKESDEVIKQVLSSAEKSLDIMEVNFSLELICALDLLNDEVCNFDNALDYMDAILSSVEENQTRVRVLMEKLNSNGMENRVSAKEFTRELEKRGLSEYVELRFFGGRMHAKAFLVDQEMLFVGSQNFHYSAWGETGLAEYNLATDDPRAVETFQKMFDYYWEDGIPWDEYK